MQEVRRRGGANSKQEAASLRRPPKKGRERNRKAWCKAMSSLLLMLQLSFPHTYPMCDKAASNL
jgi:hypothetical protein